jgi:hypothetical protein
VVTAVVGKVIGKCEQKQEHDGELPVQIPFSRKIKWLGNLLWGGSALLAFEHVWHGEVVPFFPFLTAMSDPGETATMLHEMGTIGVGMAALVTIAWGVMCFAADRIVRRSDAQEAMPLMQKEGR